MTKELRTVINEALFTWAATKEDAIAVRKYFNATAQSSQMFDALTPTQQAIVDRAIAKLATR